MGTLFKKIDHIGIAVSDLKSAIATYELMGFKAFPVEEVKDMQVRVCFLPVGESRFELLEPLSDDSVVSRFLKKRGEGIHHICLGVEDIEMTIRHLKKHRFSLVYEKPKRGAGNTWVTFVHPKSTHGILLELSQKI